MTAEGKNRIIAEALGWCWHIWAINKGHQGCNYPRMCDKCWRYPEEVGDNPDFSTWPGFGIIMERGPGRKWWEAFSYCMQQTRTPYAYWRKDLWPIDLLNPTKTHDTLSLWLKENEREWREK